MKDSEGAAVDSDSSGDSLFQMRVQLNQLSMSSHEGVRDFQSPTESLGEGDIIKQQPDARTVQEESLKPEKAKASFMTSRVSSGSDGTNVSLPASHKPQAGANPFGPESTSKSQIQSDRSFRR
jgi:hypothetical protein